MSLVLLLAALAGAVLGLLGGGGAILMVPILAYVGGAPPRQAIASSLFVVAVTSAVAAIAHARAGRVLWRTALVFGAAGMVGAHGGARIANLLDGQVMMVLFGAMILATAIAMMRPRAAAAGPAGELAVDRALLVGVGFGFVTGLVGAGGGFLIVPALVLLGGASMTSAVATSLVVIVMTAAAGLATRLVDLDFALDWRLTLASTAAAVAGSFAGAALARRIPPHGLRRGFGGFLLAMAAVVLVRELG